jgi:hypothetical protein
MEHEEGAPMGLFDALFGRRKTAVPPDSGTPFSAEEATMGPLEQEAGESPKQAAITERSGNVAQGELSISQRRRLGMKDNVRHTSSIGRR